jgi:hypothetical protein
LCTFNFFTKNKIPNFTPLPANSKTYFLWMYPSFDYHKVSSQQKFIFVTSTVETEKKIGSVFLRMKTFFIFFSNFSFDSSGFPRILTEKFNPLANDDGICLRYEVIYLNLIQKSNISMYFSLIYSKKIKDFSGRQYMLKAFKTLSFYHFLRSPTLKFFMYSKNIFLNKSYLPHEIDWN